MSSEVQTRQGGPRGGRGAGRGGRAGFSSRGGARGQNRGAATNGDAKHDSDDFGLEDQGEIGDLKKKYGSKTGLIKEMFPDWSEVDILFALKESDGDENLTVTRIAEGSISQWGEVSKPKKERTKTKGKENTFTTTTGDPAPANNTRPARGARGESGRGRGRATERGGRAPRGKSAHATNGARAEKTQISVPTEESTSWDTAKPADSWGGGWDEQAVADPAPPAAAPQKASFISEGGAKTWASMLRQSTAPKPAAKSKEAPAPPAAETIELLPPAFDAPAEPEVVVEETTETIVEVAVVELPTLVVPEVALPPSKDQLTEANLDQVEDKSHPPETDTLRSEAADSWDPRAPAISATATPLSASQHQHQAKAPASGFAATAIKATERLSNRTPSYSRRILDQEESVRMPGNRDVERTTVQFGALNFSGLDEDIDGDREEPETRAQPPDDSPIAHPRTSLPPMPQPAQMPDAFPAQKPVVSLPPTGPSTVPTAPASQQPPAAPAAQTAAQNAQYGRFGGGSQEQQSFGQKPFDSFGQQNQPSSAASQFDGFPSQQPAAQAQAQAQPAGGAFSSAPDQFSSYYTADQPGGRAPYYNNYHNYGQQQSQTGQVHQEPNAPQRPFGGYTAPQSDNLSQYPQSGASRYGAAAAAAAEAQNSGTTTPNPPTQGQQGAAAVAGAGAQGAQSQSHGQQQPHGHYGGYNSNHPYYSNAYYSAYMNQYAGQFGGNQAGYGGPYGGKGNFGHQQPYGVSPQAPYDHATSQGSGGFGQSSLHRGDSGGFGSGLGDYGRAGAGQTANQAGHASGGFGSMHDSFNRGASSYQSQAGQGFGGQSQPGAAPSAADDLKPFGDAKGATGPSPSLGGARPGSATNANQGQAGLPPPQSTQQGGAGYGGYPSHLQGHGGLHGSQSGAGGYGMGGGAAGQGQHGNTPYGGYGSQQGFGGAGGYYGNQQRGGWGNNYH